MAATGCRSRRGQPDGENHTSLLYEDKLLLQVRIERLKNPHSFSQHQPSFCQHVLQAPQLESAGPAGNSLGDAHALQLRRIAAGHAADCLPASAGCTSCGSRGACASALRKSSSSTATRRSPRYSCSRDAGRGPQPVRTRSPRPSLRASRATRSTTFSRCYRRWPRRWASRRAPGRTRRLPPR